MSIVVFTLANDLHALAIREKLVERGVTCHVVETSNMISRGGVLWESDGEHRRSLLRSRTGQWFDLTETKVVWWRRVNSPQILPKGVTDDAAIDLINNDWKAAIFGAASSGVDGVWINPPEATRRAENKLIQLGVAADAGIRTPRTIVTDDAASIHEFWHKVNGRVIVKAVRGTNLAQLAASHVCDPDSIKEDEARLSPAMYQELVPGDSHLRINCFGDRIYAALIRSRTMDWRRDLSVPFEAIDVGEELTRKLQCVLKALDLTMGVIDMKITPTGEPVWLEINPQGQFLFLEPLAGLNLTEAFTEFLLESLKAAGN